MMDAPSSDTGAAIPITKDFFLGRQPILNRSQDLLAYELLFRRAACGPANVTDDLAATATVIAHAAELGLEIVIGNALGFINIDAAALLSDFVIFLPTDKIVLEILESVTATQQLIERITELKLHGFRFALDDVVAHTDDVQKLLPLVDIVKVDIKNLRRDNLQQLSAMYKAAGKTLLAEKVETIEQFRRCLDCGFDYFQGYYFAMPVVLSGKKLEASELAILQLMALISSDADNHEIEIKFKQDVSLGLNLLRLVNTPAAGGHQPIGSIHQALQVLGRRQLQRWLQILLYTNPGKGTHTPSPLLLLATTRGRLLELIAQKTRPGNRHIADTAFTVGIMSLMDTLFGLPLNEILDTIGVVDEVNDALLHRTGLFGEMLKLAEYIEQIDDAGALLPPMLDKLRLSAEDLYALELAAFEWTNNIAGRAEPAE